MAWVETGTVPGQIIASLQDANGNVTRTRPGFPYPQVARYTGSGSTDEAANFAAFTPQRTGPGYNWAGRGLYSPGYESCCHAEGTQLVCNGGQPYPWEFQDGPNWSLSQP